MVICIVGLTDLSVLSVVIIRFFVSCVTHIGASYRPKPPKPPILRTAPTPTHVEEKTDAIGKDGSTDDEESTKRYSKKDLMWQSLFKPLPSSPEPRSSSAKLGRRLQLEVTEARSAANNLDKCTHQPAVPPHLPNSFTTQDIRQPVVPVDTQPIQSLEQEALPQGITHAVPTPPVPSTSATQDSRYKCSSCPKEYRHKKNLMAHSRTAHDPAYDKGTLCPHCGQMFTHKSTLQRHINRHTHEVEYTCVRCKKKFYTESNLNQHQETCGLKVQKYKCSVCCKCFKAKGYLSDHMGSHDDPERYQCSFCPTSFGHRGSLHMHIMKKHAK
ncbi:unnamed protein product [Owenia fusiformis]|uniref:C2H2-type domain-containing protein n=1 Tax=Owenia fusiformis TaxID=6347 RepID=A0A8S4N680_OWEFU|nr:unnamed protein product [Owenia fusiformis]